MSVGGILAMAEHRDGAPREISLELISAGRALAHAGAGALTVAVIGGDADRLVPELSLDGVDEVLHVPTASPEFNGDVHRAALRTLVNERRPAIVLTGFTVDALSYAPAVAAAEGSGLASDVVACSFEGGAVHARREFYGGKVEGDLSFPGKELVLLMLRPTVWPRASGTGSPTVTSPGSPVHGPPPRMTHRAYIAPPASDIDLAAADVILSIGRGVGSRENVPRFEQLARKLGATLACSRPLVDAGWLPPARQVGQSGTTVRPKVYLALGISGAVQHLVGMKESSTIVAVNSDPEAAIFGVAHYGAVADLFDVADALERLV